MKDRDVVLLLGSGAFLAWLCGRRNKGAYTIDYGGEEFQQVKPDGTRVPANGGGGRVTAPAPAPAPTPPSTPNRPTGGGGGASGSWADPNTPTNPPPIPDVEQPASRPDLEKINLDTAAKVLNMLGEDFPAEGNVFNLDIAQTWADHAVRLDKWADTAFERAANTKVWIHPRTAQLIANAAKAAANGQPPPPPPPPAATPREQPGDEDDRDQTAQDAADQARANQLSLDEIARRAAQLAAQQDRLTVQEPVPPAPNLPNPPPTPINLERARRSAPAVDKEVKSKRDKYNRTIVSKFQADAGLVPDGLYGPVTQSALRYFGVRDPAKPVFRSKSGLTTYTPPT